LLLALLAGAPARAAGEFDGEWQGQWLNKIGCPIDRQPVTALVENYVFIAPLGRGGLPVASTIRADNSLNIFWDGDKYLAGRFENDRFEGEAGFGAGHCGIAMARRRPPETGDAGPYDGAWRLVAIDGCLAGYEVDAAVYVSGSVVTGIATGWLTEEFSGKTGEDGRFEASATRYRISGRLPRAEREMDMRYETVSGDCSGIAKMVRRGPGGPAAAPDGEPGSNGRPHTAQ
jgi:hypothetical protein